MGCVFTTYSFYMACHHAMRMRKKSKRKSLGKSKRNYLKNINQIQHPQFEIQWHVVGQKFQTSSIKTELTHAALFLQQMLELGGRVERFLQRSNSHFSFIFGVLKIISPFLLIITPGESFETCHNNQNETHKRREKKTKTLWERVCERERKLQGLGRSRNMVQAQHEHIIAVDLVLEALTARWPWSLSRRLVWEPWRRSESEKESKNREPQRIAGATY